MYKNYEHFNKDLNNDNNVENYIENNDPYIQDESIDSEFNVEDEIDTKGSESDDNEIIIEEPRKDEIKDILIERPSGEYYEEKTDYNEEEITDDSEEEITDYVPEETDSNLEIVNINKIQEKIKNKQLLTLNDFDQITDVAEKQIMEYEDKEKTNIKLKKGVKIIVYLIIGLLAAVIIGAFLKQMKKSNRESLLEEVEPPKLY